MPPPKKTEKYRHRKHRRQTRNATTSKTRTKTGPFKLPKPRLQFGEAVDTRQFIISDPPNTFILDSFQQCHDKPSTDWQRRWEMAKIQTYHLNGKESQKLPKYIKHDKLTYSSPKRPLPKAQTPEYYYHDKEYNQDPYYNSQLYNQKELQFIYTNKEPATDDEEEENYSKTLMQAKTDLYCTIGNDYKIPDILKDFIKPTKDKQHNEKTNQQKTSKTRTPNEDLYEEILTPPEMIITQTGSPVSILKNKYCPSMILPPKAHTVWRRKPTKATQTSVQSQSERPGEDQVQTLVQSQSERPGEDQVQTSVQSQSERPGEDQVQTSVQPQSERPGEDQVQTSVQSQSNDQRKTKSKLRSNLSLKPQSSRSLTDQETTENKSQYNMN